MSRVIWLVLIAVCLLASPIPHNPGPRAIRLSLEAGQDHRAVGARRRHRHLGARAGAISLAVDGPAILHREPPRRRQHDRHRGRGTLGARRLHAADDREHAHHQSSHLQEGAVRRRPRLRADLAGGVAAEPAGGAPLGAGALAHRIDRARQAEARPADLRLRRASAPIRICRWSCSRPWPASRSGTFPTRAWARRSTTSSAGRSPR